MRELTRQVFLNIVLDDTVEEKDSGEKEPIGTVVIRGNSVIMLEVFGLFVRYKIANSSVAGKNDIGC